MLSHSNIASSKEIEIVINQLNQLMVDGLWKVDEDLPDCIEFPVANRHDSKDVFDQLMVLFSGTSLSIEYDSKTKTARIPNVKIKELYNSIAKQSSLPKEENYGYSGDGRIHDVIEGTMNASGLNYNVSKHGLCASYAIAVKKAFLAGNIHLIKERLEFFNQLPVCDLIRVDNIDFDINKDIKDLEITTTFALVRFMDQLFFVNKPENRFLEITKFKPKQLYIDQCLKPGIKARRLSEQDLDDLKSHCIQLKTMYLSELIRSRTMPAEQKADLLAFFDMIKLIQDGDIEYLFNDCDLVLTEAPPSIHTLHLLPIQATAAYVRCGKQLYFINKTNHFCKLVTSDESIVSKFDGVYRPSAKPRKLMDGELDHIPILTGYVPSFENEEAISQLINPIALSQTKIYQDTPFTGLYDFQSLCTYLRSLHHAITTSQPLISMPFSVSLDSINHCMVFGYDPKEGVWVLGNINNNKIYTFSNSEHDFLKLSASIIKGFFQDERGSVKNGFAIMQSQIEGHESDQNALEAMIQNWKQSDNFQALHQVIPDKAKLHDKWNASWLEVAVKMDDTPTALQLIDHGADVNCQDIYYKNTSLHYAAYNSNADLARALLDKQAQLNVLNEKGQTPLMIAVLNHNVEFVKMFLAANPKLDRKDKSGNSALHLAVFINNPTIVSILLNAGANPRILNQEKCSPLEMAKKEGYHEVANKISTKLFYLDQFLECVLSGDVEMARQSLIYGFLCVADLNHVYVDESLQNSLLHLAVKNNDHEMVQLLLDYQLDPNARNAASRTPLCYAVGNQNVKIIKILILSNRFKMDVDNAYKHPFCLFAGLSANHLAEIINLLKLCTSFNVNAKFNSGETLLHYAVKSAPALIDPLFQCGANPYARDDFGMTPLHYAVCMSSVNSLNALLMNPDIDRNCKTLKDLTPLMLAISKLRLDCVRRLLADKLVDRNYVNKDGLTALIYAVEKSLDDVVNELLQDDQVDLNVPGHDGRTALHAAVKLGHLEMVRALLEKGADPWICDHSGNTPRDLADNYDTAIIALLFEAMKKPKVASMPMTLFADTAGKRDVKVEVAALIKPVQTS